MLTTLYKLFKLSHKSIDDLSNEQAEFEIMKIVKSSHQNTRGILVILTLFFHNSLFIRNIKILSVHYV